MLKHSQIVDYEILVTPVLRVHLWEKGKMAL